VRIDRQRDIIRSILADHARGATQLAGKPVVLSVGDYCDPDRFTRERRLIRRRPALACFSGQLREPGDYVTVVIGGVPLVVVRGGDGRAHALVNVCRHRGSPVVVPVDGATGRASRSLRCRFHGWTYGLDGALLATPYGDDGFEGLDPACLALAAVPVAEACGLVLVRAEGDEPIDAVEALAGVDVELDEWGFGSYHRYGSWVSEWACNWKLLLDTFLETYHVFALHAETVGRYFLVRPSAFAPFGPHLRFHSLQKSFLTLADRPEEDWELLSHGTVEYLLAPASVLSHSVDHLGWYRFEPLDVDRTRVELTVFTPEPVETAEGKAHFDRTIELHRRVSGGEDFTQMVQVHASLASGAANEVIFGRNEPAAIHFHHALEQWLGS
jgi:phenylpropionate dioxygenase-like ring-hydroxylating dioxygenase large terminal subunit